MSSGDDKNQGRGGKRAGAGRPKKDTPRTKVTVYNEDRELLNSYAQRLNLPVNDLIHKLIRHSEFKNILESLE